MATTTNYSWTTPDDTGLVKDGAAAIRTLGSSVDTSLKSLSPGTTSGDIDYYTSATAKARLAKGTDGQVLTLASGVPSWATASAGGMTLLSTTTLSGATTTISSISQSYTNLEIRVFGIVPSTANVAYPLIRFQNGGTNINNTTATTMNIAGTISGSTSNTGAFTPQGTTTFLGTSADNSYVINVYDYTSTTASKKFITSTGTSFATAGHQGSTSNGYISGTLAIDAITFSLNSTYTYSGGTVQIYGVK